MNCVWHQRFLTLHKLCSQLLTDTWPQFNAHCVIPEDTERSALHLSGFKWLNSWQKELLGNKVSQLNYEYWTFVFSVCKYVCVFTSMCTHVLVCVYLCVPTSQRTQETWEKLPVSLPRLTNGTWAAQPVNSLCPSSIRNTINSKPYCLSQVVCMCVLSVMCQASIGVLWEGMIGEPEVRVHKRVMTARWSAFIA